MGAEEDKKKKASKMARRKQEVQLQQEIETTEEWEEMIAKEGLWVVDIYQEWCGPCAAMVGNFRRLKNELGDDLLHFAAAKADTVDALDKYRGRCEPCFLFFAGGVLVGVVHGANSPVILRTITEQLAAEHKVMDGSSERKEIKDPMLAGLEDREKAAFDEEENEKEEEDGNVLDYQGERVNYGDTLTVSTSPQSEEKKGFTVALIKPDAVRNGKVEEIIQQMEESGIEILAKEERQLTEDEAREFYSHLQDEDYFEDYIKFMSSGPSFALVLTKGQEGEDIIQSWRDMIGPTSVEEAKEQAPDSLRAKYGSDKYTNALHGSDSPETAAREMAFFFPDMSQPTVPKAGSKPKLQRTLALIRPDALMNNKEAILAKIKEAGFKVALQKEMTLTKEQAEEFYKEHRDKDYFDELTNRMSSGPLLALGLAREDAVQAWRDQLGPTVNAKEEAPESLRGQFAVDDAKINMLHGSDAPEAAEKELEYFFPMQQTIAAIKPDAYGTKDEIIEKIHEAGFRIAARKETTITKDIAEEFYGDHKGKEYFDDLVNHMTSGPTMFMVLSRGDAVTGWRDVIGPTDPEKAKSDAPDSLRAQFGKDILHNAIHGSSNTDHAKQSIEKVFGHLEFNPDGTVKGEENEDVIQEHPAKEQEQQAVVDTGAGEEVADVAPEFRNEETEGDTQESKQQETSDDTQQAQSEGTAQSDDTAQKGEEGEKKEGGEESETKAEGEEQEAKGGSGEEQAETKQEEGSSEQKESSEETKDETKGEDKAEESKGEDKSEEAKGDDSKGEDSKQEESKGEDAKGEESKSDDAKGDDAKGDDAKGDDAKGDDAKGDDAKGDDAKGDDAKGGDAKGDDAKGDDAKEDDKKTDDAKADDVKGDDDKKEEEKGEEAAKTEEAEKKEEADAKKDDDKTEEAKT